jgi:hypothetical protein
MLDAHGLIVIGKEKNLTQPKFNFIIETVEKIAVYKHSIMLM